MVRGSRKAAKPKGGDKHSHRIEAHAATILGAIGAKPDITLTELAALLKQQQGALFARSTVHRFCVRHRLILIFVDESGASTKMARLRGRALRGERCRAAIPHGHLKTTTFTGALTLHGMTAPMVSDGPVNGSAFLAYVEQVLAPTLRPAASW